MTGAHAPLILSLAVAAAVAGCGAAGSPAASASPAVATADGGGLHVTVRRPPGGPSLQVTVTVAGPATVESGCVATLTAWVVDGKGTRVTPPEPPRGMGCHAIVAVPVAAGGHSDFSTAIPVPAAPGHYAVHGLLRLTPAAGQAMPSENLPPVALVLP